MDKSKRKSLIISYLRDSINLRDFSNEVDMDLQAMSDPILGAIRSDLSVKANASIIKGEILAFEQKQEEGLVSLGSDYIEAEKRRLTLQACGYKTLLADPEVRAIMEKWGTTNEIAIFETSAEEYKNTSFTYLLEFLEDHPEYNSEIQEILTEIESENGLSDELQEFSDEVNNKDEEQNDQNIKKDELVAFLDETVHTFDTLLQLDDIDEETIETIRNASTQSYRIYREKFSEMTAKLANNPSVFATKLYPTSLETRKELVPDLQGKIQEIQSMIEKLEEKYGDFTQSIDGKEQERPEDETIRDEVGDEFKPKTSEQKQDEKQAQVIWSHRLQGKDTEIDKMQEGAYKKQEIVQLIQDIDKKIQKAIQQENQQEQANIEEELSR